MVFSSVSDLVDAGYVQYSVSVGGRPTGYAFHSNDCCTGLISVLTEPVLVFANKVWKETQATEVNGQSFVDFLNADFLRNGGF